MYKNYIKRFLDFFIALFVILLLSPIFIFLIIWIHFANKGDGVFFLQERLGKNNKLFKVIKFKTMRYEFDDNGNLLPAEQRLTSIGKFVRSTSLDELPQLFNVLKGDMALIGPRPLLTRYLELYSPVQARRHEVRPGLTGWAQCNGRNDISWKRKFELDVWYVDHISFLLDLKIIFKTIKKVLKREGISKGESVIIEPFNGTN